MAVHDLDYILRRGVSEIIIEREFRERIAEGKPLRLKMGFDPSRPDLHLGYAVALRKLRQLQDIGHKVILIVGDWTARIGDPTGQSATRVMLTEAQVNENAQSYMRQFFKIVDKARTEVVTQSTWFGKFGLTDIIDLTSRFTVAQMLAREDFAQRYAGQKPIAITEFLYPLLQGYDSVAIEADVEFGGMDQKFNCLVGRELQVMKGQRPQQVLLMPLLLGTDGRKMSQSYGNYIAFEAPPEDMYAKLMSIPDEIEGQTRGQLILDYFELLTDVADSEILEMRHALANGAVNPMDLKHQLAKEIVTLFHDPHAAREGEERFRRVVQGRALPEDIQEVHMTIRAPKVTFAWSDSEGDHRAEVGFGSGAGLPAQGKEAPDRTQVTLTLPQGGSTTDAPVFLSEVIAALQLTKSRGEARRLLAQGAVEIDGLRQSSDLAALKHESILKVGKRRFIRVVG